MIAQPDPHSEPNEKADPHPFDAGAYLSAVANGGVPDDSVPTGFPSVDTLLGGGIRRGDLVVLGGEAGAGKSALALGILLRIGENGGQAAYLTGEMSAERVYDRALAIETRLRFDQVHSGKLDDAARSQIAAAAAKLRTQAPVIRTIPEGGVTGLSDILIEHLGLQLVVVDPVQWLLVAQDAMDEQLARMARELKALALRRSVAVLAVSSLRAATRDRPDPRPRLDDFGALGALKQHADVVLGLFREEMYSDLRDVQGAAELHVLKNRHGALGYADLYFYKESLRFEDVVD
ncbi:MAG TPA: DnaB-like helicase C-terminal domain-containing protein [Gemmatimonadaceae bacterium]|nr:DnaB-like helicase C-terminal domain-containing protein [Gemmatimonadaceae bacterium]